MLTLRRKPGQTIVVSPPGQTPIRVTLVEIDRGFVRIGIAADDDTLIHREEVYRHLTEEERNSRRK